MQVKTTNSEQIWQSPDGARSIWEVTLKADDGHEYRLKTYSPKVSQLGFAGEVESYQNPRGDRFVRQKPQAKVTSSAGSYQRDDNAIKAQWAIGQAINLASVKMDKKDITMPVIENYAKETDRKFDLAEITVNTKRIPSGMICVEVEADLK